jgi:hypothetical protein
MLDSHNEMAWWFPGRITYPSAAAAMLRRVSSKSSHFLSGAEALASACYASEGV